MKVYANFVEPKRFEQKFQDLSHIDFSFFFEYKPTLEELAQNEVNIFVCEEPNEYFGLHDWIIQNHQKFSLVLSWDERVLRSCSNSKLLLFGESWLDDGTDRITKKRTKKFEVSHLTGKKLLSYGHALRHQIYNRQNEITVPIKFHQSVGTMNTFADNISGKDFILGESMFSICIENTAHNNYFTEKITDCVLMKTVPIYWGCTNIAEHYDERGIIQFRGEDDAINLINKLTEDDYHRMLPYVEANYKRAFEYKNFLSRIKDNLIEIFKYNGIL